MCQAMSISPAKYIIELDNMQELKPEDRDESKVLKAINIESERFIAEEQSL